MKRDLLPQGDYFAILRDVLAEDNNMFEFVWTIDVGMYAGRNLKDRFSHATKTRTRLLRFCKDVNINPTFYDSDWLTASQFLNTRAQITVTVSNNDKMFFNRIVAYGLPTVAPQLDIYAEPDTTHFTPQFKPKRIL